jgi:tetratricopeptide (TPR) repeat protein
MMKRLAHNKCAVTAFLLLLGGSVGAGLVDVPVLPSGGIGAGALFAQEMQDPNASEGSDPLAGWFAELADPDYAGWARAQADIEREWSKSGSAGMDLMLMRAEQDLDEGDLESAIEDLTALTDHAPDFAAGFAARGVAYYMAGDHGPALRDLAQAVALEPRHFGALGLTGQIYEEMGQEARAMVAYSASFAINPHQQDVADAIARIKKSQEGTAL